jgi:2-oxoglutarate ferredoxin oxidoreductase subunit alpha
MTEAVGMASMIEAPVVFINVQRGGPSTGIPTKTEQADLNQVFGASQGDYPRVIIAPVDTVDCYYTAVEAFNLSEKYQLPVLILSDLLLSEHPETIERDALRPDNVIERGDLITEWPGTNGPFKRYKMTKSGISPRALPGTPHTVHVAPSDDHDEEGILISDMFTSPPMRRKIQEKRMKKVELVRRELTAPETYGPDDADVTLIGWGSSKGVIREAVDKLNARDVKTNQLHVRYLHPFQGEEVQAILAKAKRTYCVEVNYTGQFARHLRAETGISVDGLILKYDGEPLGPNFVVSHVETLLQGNSVSLDVTEGDAREMAYHFIRTHLTSAVRPGTATRADGKRYGEAVWFVQIISKDTREKQGALTIGVETGATYSWQPQPKGDSEHGDRN